MIQEIALGKQVPILYGSKRFEWCELEAFVLDLLTRSIFRSKKIPNEPNDLVK